jgi:hypothetical protein
MVKTLKSLAYELLLTYRYVIGKAKIYHNGPRKSRLKILKELGAWYISECEVNRMYYAFGLNLKERKQNEYIGRKEFLKVKNKVENTLRTRAGCHQYNYDIVTKDKFIANSLFAGNNIPCIENLTLYCNSTLLFKNGTQTDIQGFTQFGAEFIVKNTVLEAGDGVLICRLLADKIEVNGIIQSIESFKSLLGDKVWVVQQRYESSSEIRKINSTALNTTRIVTIINNNKPEYLCGFQSFATGNATTDSWSKGSVYVGIDIKNERLGALGYCNLDDKEKSIVKRHPDTEIEFDGYKIPGMKDAVELCLRAHKLLYFNFAIGWDIAITNNGPFIVEANEKPGMNVAQCVDGGMRKKIYDCANKLNY